MLFKNYKLILCKFIQSIKENEDPVKFIYKINIRKLHHIYSEFRRIIFSPIMNSFIALCKLRSNNIFYSKLFKGNFGKKPVLMLGIKSIYKKLYMKKSQKPSKITTLFNKLNDLKQLSIENINKIKIFANVLVISSFLSVLVICLPFSSIVGLVFKRAYVVVSVHPLILKKKIVLNRASIKSISEKLIYFFNTYVLFLSIKKKTKPKTIIICLSKKLPFINI